VFVKPYRSIERYSHVMHIVSGVHGKLAAGKDAFDLFGATFPAGTLVGAPKVRAMQIIDELEPTSRGLYGGTVGYFGTRSGAPGDMDQAITIRTLVFRGDEYSYQAGGGIVADSVPEAEHNEVLAKSAALRRALELAEEGM
jgi:anthranilate synthase component 1